MRITNGMMVNTLMRNLGNNLKRMDKIQQNLATGKKFINPSDDPIGVSRSLRLNTDLSVMDQYKRNVSDSQSWMETTEIALSNITEVLKRAKELTVQAANETYSVEQRTAISGEIEQLKAQLISIANSNYAGSYVFSGYKTDKKLMNDLGVYDVGGQTLSDSESIGINVGNGDRLGINFVGQRVFGIGLATDPITVTGNAIGGTSKSQLIDVFEQLVTDLKADDTAGISSALSRIESYMNNTSAVTAEIGVKGNRLELTSNRIEDDVVNLKSLLSKNEDADIAEVIMNLKNEENVYRASLSGGAKIIQPSLVDFIR